MELMSVGKASRLMGLTPNTLRRYADKGEIKTVKMPSGHRRFDLSEHLDVKPTGSTTICYARVSTQNQKKQLEIQKECLTKQHPGCEIISDIASGLNFKRKGLNSILDRALQGESIILVCTYRDRITRFGFDLIEKLITRTGGKIVVLNKIQTSPIEELTQDLIFIITCFSTRIYGLRSNKNKKILYETIKGTKNTPETMDGSTQVDVQPSGCLDGKNI